MAVACRRPHEEGADALATGEEGAAHGLVKGLRRQEGDGCFQRPVDEIAFPAHVGLEVEGRGSLVILPFPLSSYYICFGSKEGFLKRVSMSDD